MEYVWGPGGGVGEGEVVGDGVGAGACVGDGIGVDVCVGLGLTVLVGEGRGVLEGDAVAVVDRVGDAMGEADGVGEGNSCRPVRVAMNSTAPSAAMTAIAMSSFLDMIGKVYHGKKRAPPEERYAPTAATGEILRSASMPTVTCRRMACAGATRSTECPCHRIRTTLPCNA